MQGTFNAEARKQKYYCGLDVSHSTDGDSSVLCIRQGPCVRAFHLWREPDARVLRAKVIEVLQTYGIYPTPDSPIPMGMFDRPAAEARIYVDVRGVGGPVYDELLGARYPVSKYDSGAKPWKPLQFANKRAEEHWGLRTKLERHELAIPFDLGKMEIRGEPVGLMNDLRQTNTSLNAGFGITPSGMLAYLGGGNVLRNRHMVVVDRLDIARPDADERNDAPGRGRRNLREWMERADRSR